MANFATFNPLAGGTNLTYSEGNLLVSAAGGGTNFHSSYSSIGVTSGKYYAEFTWLFGESNDSQIGVASHIYPRDASNQNGITSGVAVVNFNQNYFNVDGGDAEQSGLSSASIGDVFGVALNADDNEITFYKNGSAWTTTHSLPTVLGPIFFITSTRANPTGAQIRANFGQRPFRYDPPSGFVALSTENLAEPPISNLAAEKPEDYFNTVLYTGTGSEQSITVGFQPDFIWWKGRNQSSSHLLMNAVIGNTRYLFSNATSAEQTDGTNVLTTFDADGFTVPDDTGGYANLSGRTYVAWCWKAGGTTVSNTNGSITSQVSANTDAGFSIVSYTGTGSAATVGHGLNTAPSLIIVKPRNETANWVVYHSSVGATKYLLLNTSSAEDTASTVWNNTAPTSSVFSLGTNTNVNGNTTQEIAYCWHSVEGFSKFGSYTGNGSADGPFVYCGFRPAFVLIKSTASGSWHIRDNRREGYNPQTDLLFPDLSDDELNLTDEDILSNGFKLRTTGSGRNASGTRFIFAAFAESPFKYSSAR